MTDTHAPTARARTLVRWALATLGMFAAHHVYGAVRYATPWRHHAALVALVAGLALLAASSRYQRDPDTPRGRLAGWTLAALVFVVPVLLVGVFEGAFNHGVKDALFYAGAPRSLLLRLFPPPKYEMPNDALFEVSGVLQAVLAAFTARAAWRFARALRQGAAARGPSRPGAARGIGGAHG